MCGSARKCAKTSARVQLSTVISAGHHAFSLHRHSAFHLHNISTSAVFSAIVRVLPQLAVPKPMPASIPTSAPAPSPTNQNVGSVPLLVFPSRLAASEADSVRGFPGLSRPVVNFWLDALLLLLFLLQALTAVLVQFVFPPASAAQGWTLWGLALADFCSLQFAFTSLLGLGILIHLMLHWSWVCAVVARRLLKASQVPDSGLQTIYGVGLLIVVLVTGAAVTGLATVTIQMPRLP